MILPFLSRFCLGDNSEARGWRRDSDKQTGMVDDFEDFFKGKGWCS